MDSALPDDPSGLVYGLHDYAHQHPDDPRWREQLLRGLAPDSDPRVLEHHLDRLTLYPGHGAFAVPAVLRLTSHPTDLVKRERAEFTDGEWDARGSSGGDW